MQYELNSAFQLILRDFFGYSLHDGLVELKSGKKLKIYDFSNMQKHFKTKICDFVKHACSWFPVHYERNNSL